MPRRTNALTIRTPEGVSFSLDLAGPVTRFLAWLVDIFVISLSGQLVASVLQITGVISTDVARALVILSYFVISMGYGIALEWLWRGQTLGKRLLRLRVMDEQGLGLKFSQVAIRNLFRAVDSLPLCYLVGGSACLISSRAQRLGDLAAGTVVVRHPKISAPDLDQILEDKYNSFNDYPHLEARLRQRVGPVEAGLALSALLRRKELNPGARIELFHDLAEYYKGLVEFPAEVVAGISDEQYVRNVVATVYRSSR